MDKTLIIKRFLCPHTDVDVSSGAGMKTGKSSKIDRITHILEGRKDSKFEHDGHAGGLTNKEKLRKKNFIMVRKGKKSVNNKSRKAAGLDRHEKNTAVSLLIRLSTKVSSPKYFVHFGRPFELRRFLTALSYTHLRIPERAIWTRQEKETKNIKPHGCIIMSHFSFGISLMLYFCPSVTLHGFFFL